MATQTVYCTAKKDFNVPGFTSPLTIAKGTKVYIDTDYQTLDELLERSGEATYFNCGFEENTGVNAFTLTKADIIRNLGATK